MGLLQRLCPRISLFLVFLNGCVLSTHKIQRIEMPSHVMTASAKQLVDSVNQHCEDIQSLAAIADFRLIEGGPKKGRQTTTSSFRGSIIERKPGALRVTVRLPLVGTPAVDLATEGQRFTLLVPTRNEAYEGANTATKVSINPLENLRPNVFADSLLLGCIAPNDLVTLTSETKTMLDAKAKHLTAQPDYDLVVLQHKEVQELTTQRVIHFNRTDLVPYEVDIYDQNGAIQTEATYGPLQKFGEVDFPKTISIKRPLDELQIVMTFESLTVNHPISTSKFELPVPAGTTIHHLD